MDHYFMEEAYKEAEKAFKEEEVPVGAIIVKDRKIISRGYNKTEGLKNPLAHAEIEAIDRASDFLGQWRLLDCTLYVTLEPCAMCAGAIINSRLKRVVIATRDFKRGCCGSFINLLEDPGFNHNPQLEFGVLEEKSRELLQLFFKKLRNNKKKF